MYRNIEIITSSNFLNEWRNTAVDVKLIIIKEQWVLRVVSKILLFGVVSSFFVIIGTIEISWFEMLSVFLDPLWMGEESQWSAS